MKNPKNLSKQKLKEIEQSVFKLEEPFSSFKEYRFQNEFKYKNLGNIRNLFNGIAFNQSIDESYYRPITTKSAFNGNCIEYESKGENDKNLSPKTYLDMIRPYLSDIINNHKTPKKLRVYHAIK